MRCVLEVTTPHDTDLMYIRQSNWLVNHGRWENRRQLSRHGRRPLRVCATATSLCGAAVLLTSMAVAKMHEHLTIISGRAHPRLAGEIAAYLGIDLGRVDIWNFPDGEIGLKLDQNIRGRDVFIVQPTCPPVNESLMELLILIDACKRASADRITTVIPYFGYARQDRKDAGRVPITAKLVANLIVEAGADRVLAMDLHAAQIQGFFDVPVDHLYAAPILDEYFAGLNLPRDEIVVVSPDEGSIKRTLHHQERLGGTLCIVDAAGREPRPRHDRPISSGASGGSRERSPCSSTT